MAEFNEEYYFEQFGVSPQTTDSEEAEVSEKPEETPEDVREPETEPNEEPVDAQPEESDEGAAKPKQTKKENAQFAAARRKAEAERDAAIEAERQKAKADVDALIADMGLENPYTNQPITTKAEYDEYKATHAQKEQEQRLRDMDMTQEQYDEYVGNLPEVQQARKIAEETKKQQYEAWVKQELTEITAVNPAIKTAEDLASDPRYDEILRMVQNNYRISDAYKLAHMDDLAQRTGRQQAINRQGKAHMTSTQSRGGEGPVNVPADEMDMFRRLVPDATDDEIGKFYNRMVHNE
jgi:hypothetical protein